MNIDVRREIRKDLKFYFSMICGVGLLVMGAIMPPLGVISNSILFAGGMILCIAAGCIGIDLTEIIHQFRLLKDGKCVDNDQS